MSVSLDRGTTIGKLRLLAAAADPHALRMRGGTVLGALDFQPPAMPEQSILCIRRLHDPLPGGIDLRSPAAPRPAAWEVAMRGAVGAAMRRAARPALGPVPASAEAVFFADRAELLACAARDALRGALALHWWWTHLLGGERSHAAVVREWTRAPAYVPAAVELLAAWREIASFALALAPSDAVLLLEAVLRAHALPAPAIHLAAALTASAVPLLPQPAAEPRTTPPPETRLRTDLLTVPPWRAIVADLAPVLAALPIEQQSFLAVALVLRRAPALVRSERFAREAVAWIEGARPSRPASPHPPAPSPVRATSLPPRTGEGELAELPRRIPSSPRAVAPLSRSGWGEEGTRGRGVGGEGGWVADDFGTVLPLPAAEPGIAPPEPRPSDPPVSVERTPPDPAAPETPAPSAGLELSETVPSAGFELSETVPPAGLELSETVLPVDFELAIDSDFSGVFFLLNVGIALDLYSDFTSPVQCGIDLDIWDFLALTGGALVLPPLPGGGRGWERRSGGEGLNGAAFASDPIWPLLAMLANRGDGVPPGAGFTPPDGQPLTAWLAATVERIRERLALAGLDDPSRVVRRYGRVTTTPAHLDVHFSLAAHPIEIRMAGLDRDPGWIPAAGRHVAFHFD